MNFWTESKDIVLKTLELLGIIDKRIEDKDEANKLKAGIISAQIGSRYWLPANMHAIVTLLLWGTIITRHLLGVDLLQNPVDIMFFALAIGGLVGQLLSWDSIKTIYSMMREAIKLSREHKENKK